MRVWYRLALMVGSLCACAPRVPARPVFGQMSGLVPGGRDPMATFLHELNTWTRHDKVYQVLDNKLFVSATYHAPDFRHAFGIAFPDIYGHGGKITRRELTDMTGGVEQHHNFLVAAYTPYVRWNDFARDDSIWRISLYSKSVGDDGMDEAEVAPDDIIPLKVDENLRAVYPYISRFDKIYLVRFPMTDAWQRPLVHARTQEVVMRIASALGVATLRWPMHPEMLAPPTAGAAPRAPGAH